MKFVRFALIVSLGMPKLSLAESFAAPTQEVWNFYNKIATAKVGKKIECYGDWDLHDSPNLAPIKCESLGMPSIQNSMSIKNYLHNGWEIVDRQVFPHFPKGAMRETDGWKRVVVRLKKVEARKQYVDPYSGPLDPVVRPLRLP